MPNGKQPVILAPSGLPRFPVAPQYAQPFAVTNPQPSHRPEAAEDYSPANYFDVDHFEPNSVVEGESRVED
jgi:hypothetical protein